MFSPEQGWRKRCVAAMREAIKKWGTELNREFTTDELRMARRHLRSCSTSLAIREMQIKTTLNLIEEKVGSSLQDIGTGDHFLSRNPVAQTIRESMNKWDLLKLRSFCKTKDTVSKTKRQHNDWKMIFTNPSSDKDLFSKIYKELKKLDTKTLINPIKNGILN